MRTKALILSAMVGIAGVVSSFAQGNVYSVNVVGYINLDLDTGYTMIANQLDNGQGNLVKDLMTSLSGFPSVYKFNGVGYDTMSFIGGAGWFPTEVADTMTLAPGEGMFIQLDTAQTVTFVGEVMQGDLVNGPLAVGFNVVSSMVPQAGAIGTDLGYVPSNNDSVYMFNPATQAYKTSSYIEGVGWFGDFGTPGEPTVSVGESFFLQAAAANSWDRSFTVN